VTLDFRVGGREVNLGGPEGGPLHRVDAERKISASLGVIEIAPHGRGARLTFTEHGAFLDGYDGLEERREGTAAGLEQLGRWLERPALAV